LKVLVTGSQGFVGRHVSTYLKRHGFEVIGTDVTPGADVVGSITDREFVQMRLAEQDFEAVVHLAGIADLKKTIEDPWSCFQVNCFGTLNALDMAYKKGVKRFVFASSANVYGAPVKNPVSEDDPMAPRVPYDYSKVVGEGLATSFFKTKGVPIAVTRAWLLFGEYDQPSRAVPFFIRACLKGEAIKLFNSGRDTTAPSHASNYGKLISKILVTDGAVGEAFNFGGSEAISIRQLSERIKHLTGSGSDLQNVPPRSPAESQPQVSYPSLQKAKRVLGFEHDLSLDDGLRRTIEWVRQSERVVGA
jgi:nucleoside-diphosphate-sugar epimerase